MCRIKRRTDVGLASEQCRAPWTGKAVTDQGTLAGACCADLPRFLQWGMSNPNDILRAEIAGLRTDIQALTAGLTIMLEVQEAHGDLLRQLGEALGQEPDGPSPVAEALERLVAIGRDHTDAI